MEWDGSLPRCNRKNRHLVLSTQHFPDHSTLCKLQELTNIFTHQYGIVIVTVAVMSTSAHALVVTLRRARV
eukprot:7180404-Prorocentrum_lima.AAC.1